MDKFPFLIYITIKKVCEVMSAMFRIFFRIAYFILLLIIFFYKIILIYAIILLLLLLTLANVGGQQPVVQQLYQLPEQV